MSSAVIISMTTAMIIVPVASVFALNSETSNNRNEYWQGF
jgi:hypothetical protein